MTLYDSFQLPMITIRGVELASLFMRGVEHAIFINDACGAPIPWGFTCPWHFFDGKLFHFKLLKANNNTQLIDMCDGQVCSAFVIDANVHVLGVSDMILNEPIFPILWWWRLIVSA